MPCAQFTPQSEYCTNNQVPDPGYAKYINPGTGAREKLLVERARRGRQRTRRPAAPAPALRGRGPGAVARYGAYRGAASLGAALAAGGLVADVVVDLGLGYCAVDRGALESAWRAFSRASRKP